MAAVIVNDKGELYAGFSSEQSKPIWRRSKCKECVLEEAIAETVVRQLKQLGFDKIIQRDADGVARKWVPTDTDAAAL